MPVLRQAAANVKQFFLPSTASLPEPDQAWVKMDIGDLLAGDFMDVVGNDANPTAGTITGEMLASRIKEWNFTEPDGQLSEINFENIRRLEAQDLTYLFNQFDINKLNTGLDDTQKKT